jgi:hypothetical protein
MIPAQAIKKMFRPMTDRQLYNSSGSRYGVIVAPNVWGDGCILFSEPPPAWLVELQGHRDPVSIELFITQAEEAEKREIFPTMIGDSGILQFCQFTDRNGETLVAPAHQVSTILKKAGRHKQALEWHRCTPRHTEVITASLPGQMVAVVCPSVYDDDKATPEDWEWSLINKDIPPHPDRIRPIVTGPTVGEQLDLL